MPKFRANLLDRTGIAISGATVTVYDAGTSNLATIYSDQPMSVVVPGSVLTTDTDGEFQFFAAAGEYKYTFEKNGTTGEEDFVVLAGLPSSFNVRDYGAVGGGITDDTAAIQRVLALALAAGNGSEVYLPVGTYLLSSKLTVSKGIYIRGAGYGDVTDSGSNIMSSTASGTKIQWTGGAEEMVHFVAAAANSTLHGGGIQGILLDGNNAATICVRVSSCRETMVDVATYRPTVGALLLDDTNGRLCDSVHVPRLIARVGSNALAAPAYGIWIKGDISATTFGCTNCYFGDVDIEFDDGDALIFEDCDACVVVKFKATGRPGFTGRTAYFKNGDGSFPACKNVIVFGGGGRYVAENLTVANRVMFLNGEGASVDNGGNTGALCYDVHDRLHGDVFTGQVRYPMSDRLPVSVGDMIVGTNAVATGAGTPGWPVISLPNAVTAFLTFSFPSIFNWNNGLVTGIRIFTFPSLGDANVDVRLTLDAITRLDGEGGINTVEATVTATKQIAATINTLKIVELLFATPMTYLRGDWLSMKLSRIGADAADTSSAAVYVAGIQVLFRCDGPDSNTPTYDIPLNQIA